MENEDMLYFNKKLDEAYNRWLNEWLTLWLEYIKKTYEDNRNISDKYVYGLISTLEKQFNLVQKWL